MERITLFADILLPLPVPGTFTYRVPYDLNEFVTEGQRVAVQFGRKKIYAGLIRKLHREVPEYVPKYILHLLDEKPLVNDLQFRFWDWISAYYMSTRGQVMQAALPAAFKLSSESKILLSPDFLPDRDNLDEFEYRVTEALLAKKRLAIDEISKIVGFQKVLPLLKKMIEKNMLVMEEELKEGYKPKMERFVSLSDEFRDEDAMRELMDGLGKRAYKQLELLMHFLRMAGFPMEMGFQIRQNELLKKAESSPAVLRALTEKGVFMIAKKAVSRLDETGNAENRPNVVLSEHQHEAFHKINNEFCNHNVVLLHGITSSGKTEIYIKLIEEALKAGKQVLYLLPEIALTTQIINRLRKYFGDEVGVYHSRYNRNEKAEVWNNIARRDEGDVRSRYRIILGPRSAMFLPFTNLGLIIVDEEHDQSYKQYDPAPRYNARDSAIYLASLHQAKVVLGSATPAIESFYNARSGKYGLATLTERYSGINLPEVVVVNMKDQMHRKLLRSHFSSVLLDHIEAALQENQQVILFQNRRGFSLRIECEVCNWVPECKNCDVTLTYHKHSELLKCHYCGFSIAVPATCSECGSTDLKMKGFGTEKVEEELGFLLPDAQISRMDLDSTRSKHALQRIFYEFETGKTNILTGTQMVTKGLDFDNVQVVGVLSADNMLSFPDFRAHERSYQMMAQVSGRAGRKNKRGKVIIQSWQPSHPIIKNVVENNYEGMVERELSERKRFKYPPFHRLIVIRMKHKDPQLLSTAASAFGKLCRTRFGNRIQGPEEPLVARVRSFYIRQLLLKTPREAGQSTTKKQILSLLEEFRKITKFKPVMVHFDVDPQ
ncbi:MAG: primosomal protein N' [Bacteroidales bacterium]|nr:primosomal protein N' [Bacteroidales bacterium]